MSEFWFPMDHFAYLVYQLTSLGFARNIIRDVKDGGNRLSLRQVSGKAIMASEHPGLLKSEGDQLRSVPSPQSKLSWEICGRNLPRNAIHVVSSITGVARMT